MNVPYTNQMTFLKIGKQIWYIVLIILVSASTNKTLAFSIVHFDNYIFVLIPQAQGLVMILHRLYLQISTKFLLHLIVLL